MVKKITAAAIILLVLGSVGAFFYTPEFDAERILKESRLKERTFDGKVQEISALDGKISAYLIEEHSLPLVAVSFGFARAGKAYEDKVGAALLAESVLTDGAGQFDRRQLRDLMKEKGIKLDVSAGNDRLDFSLSYVKSFEKEALDVLKAVLYEPHLKDEDLNLARQQLAMLKKRQAENPSQKLGELVDKKFYGAHPYGRDDIPDFDVLNRIGESDIRAYLRSRMAKNVLTVGISGDIDRAEAEALLVQVFGGLEDVSAAPESVAFVPDFTLEPAKTEAETAAQSFVLMLTAGIKRLDEDFYPLYLADYIFGGSGLSSRLSKAVREEAGLTYGIYSMFSNSDAVDLWQIYFSAAPENVTQIMQIAQDQYRDFYQNGVSAAELELAKKSLTASFNLRFASLFNIAEMLKNMQIQKLGADFLETRQAQVNAVTLEQVNAAIQKHLPKTLEPAAGVRLFELSGKSR